MTTNGEFEMTLQEIFKTPEWKELETVQNMAKNQNRDILSIFGMGGATLEAVKAAIAQYK